MNNTPKATYMANLIIPYFTGVKKWSIRYGLGGVSFGDDPDTMCVMQSAIERRPRRVEAMIDAHVITRNADYFAPTSVGMSVDTLEWEALRLLHDSAVDILEGLDEFDRSLAALRGALETLDVSRISAVVHAWLNRWASDTGRVRPLRQARAERAARHADDAFV